MTDSKTPLNLGKIILKNYRAYRGETTIELSRDPTKTITVIEGNMGIGKTSLLEAIYWCLYGEGRSDGAPSSDESIITNDVFKNMKIGDRNETSVEILLYERDELRYKIKRAIEFVKNKESATTRHNTIIGGTVPDGITVADVVEYSERPKRSDNWIPITDQESAKVRIENIFPKSLSSYFLFDAELLTNFFNSDDEKHVKYGIERISGLPIIDKAVRDLHKTSDDIRRGIRDVNLDPLQDELTHMIKTMDHATAEIKKRTTELVGVRKEKEGIESFLRQHGEDRIKQWQEENDRLEKELKEIKGSRDKLDKDMSSKLLYYNTILRLYDSMQSSMDKCNTWEKEGKIPIAVSGHALRNILSKDPPECICGTILKKDSPGWLRIHEHLDKNLAESPVIQSIGTGRGHWGDMIDEISQIHDEMNELVAKRTELDLAYDAAKEKQKKISNQLTEYNADEVRTKSSRLKELKSTDYEITGKIAIEEERHKKTKLEHQIKDREYSTELKKHQKFSSHRKRLVLANKLKEAFKQCQDELIDEMRNTVQKKTTEYFERLVSRDDFKEVEIKPSYEVFVLGQDGKSKQLSAGQSCCLAMSYIAAIRDIAQRDYFMLIDSPLHNISQSERVEIAKHLPQFLPEMQITLLMQDQEFKGVVGDSSSVKDTLVTSNSLWRHYVLKSIKGDQDDIAARTVLEEVK